LLKQREIERDRERELIGMNESGERRRICV
jgi:hypothetical protein